MSSSLHEPGRPAAPPEPARAELSLSKGASIGRYIILGPLGRGGMGEVYAASNIAGRTLKINGVAFVADGTVSALPDKVNGGYCLQATAGGLTYASFATW